MEYILIAQVYQIKVTGIQYIHDVQLCMHTDDSLYGLWTDVISQVSKIEFSIYGFEET